MGGFPAVARVQAQREGQSAAAFLVGAAEDVNPGIAAVATFGISPVADADVNGQAVLTGAWASARGMAIYLLLSGVWGSSLAVIPGRRRRGSGLFGAGAGGL